VTWVYMTNEDRQLWQVPGGPPSADDDSGATFWLPGGVCKGEGGCTIAHMYVQAAGPTLFTHAALISWIVLCR